MEKVLIFKTASDAIMERLFTELQSLQCEKICLIQTSLKDIYQKKYPYILFIDIEKEGFYEIPKEVLLLVQKMKINKIYIPTTGVRAINFGNIIELCNKLCYKELIFYNSNGEESIVRKKGAFVEWLIKIYIGLIELLYRK